MGFLEKIQVKRLAYGTFLNKIVTYLTIYTNT